MNRYVNTTPRYDNLASHGDLVCTESCHATLYACDLLSHSVPPNYSYRTCLTH